MESLRNTMETQSRVILWNKHRYAKFYKTLQDFILNPDIIFPASKNIDLSRVLSKHEHINRKRCLTVKLLIERLFSELNAKLNGCRLIYALDDKDMLSIGEMKIMIDFIIFE